MKRDRLVFILNEMLQVVAWIIAVVIMQDYGMTLGDVLGIVCLISIPACISAFCNGFVIEEEEEEDDDFDRTSGRGRNGDRFRTGTRKNVKAL